MRPGVRVKRKALLRRLQVEAPENAAGRVEQDDVRLGAMDRLRIERDQIARNLHRFKSSLANVAARLSTPRAER